MFSLRYIIFYIPILACGVLFNTAYVCANEKFGCISNSELYTPVLDSDKYLHKQALMQWKMSWESTSIDNYIGYYSKEFDNGKKNYQQWKKHKQNIFAKNAHKINISLSQINIYRFVNKSNTIRIQFFQDYESPNYSSKDNKEQIWQLEDDGKWRVI